MKHNMRQQVAKYQKNHIDFPSNVKINEICFLQEEKVILEHIVYWNPTLFFLKEFQLKKNISKIEQWVT